VSLFQRHLTNKKVIAVVNITTANKGVSKELDCNFLWFMNDNQHNGATRGSSLKNCLQPILYYVHLRSRELQKKRILFFSPFLSFTTYTIHWVSLAESTLK
jgi:hypothetical protein